jgi:hypothetical protein
MGFTINPPKPTGLKPRRGPAGTSVTIRGSCFSGATAVTFGGTAAQGYKVDSDEQITAVVAPGTTGGKVGVTTPNGKGTSSAAFTVTP